MSKIDPVWNLETQAVFLNLTVLLLVKEFSGYLDIKQFALQMLYTLK